MLNDSSWPSAARSCDTFERYDVRRKANGAYVRSKPRVWSRRWLRRVRTRNALTLSGSDSNTDRRRGRVTDVEREAVAFRLRRLAAR